MTAGQSGRDGQGAAGARESGAASPGSREAEVRQRGDGPSEAGAFQGELPAQRPGADGALADGAGQEPGCRAKVHWALGRQGGGGFGVQWWVPGTARGSCWGLGWGAGHEGDPGRVGAWRPRDHASPEHALGAEWTSLNVGWVSGACADVSRVGQGWVPGLDGALGPLAGTACLQPCAWTGPAPWSSEDVAGPLSRLSAAKQGVGGPEVGGRGPRLWSRPSPGLAPGRTEASRTSRGWAMCGWGTDQPCVGHL